MVCQLRVRTRGPASDILGKRRITMVYFLPKEARDEGEVVGHNPLAPTKTI